MPNSRSAGRAPTRRRNPRGEGGRLRDELIDAAATLMRTGAREDQITIRAVTRKANVAPQSFYLHFTGIDGLLWEVYAREFSTLTQRLATAARSANAPHDQIRAICLAYCQFATSHPQAYRLMFSLTGQPDHAWEGELPGAPAFEILRGSVQASKTDRDQTEIFRTTSLLWAGLHGLVGLRNDRPAFPWAPLETLVEDLLMALLPGHS
ncbi:MAG: TetR/AcrR family transcriptional regulator [Solirubrobacteraceae bacterium]